MPPAKPIPGSPQEWLARARSDLALARAPLPDGAVFEDLCFHAQQAVEKAIKAVYQEQDWPFAYTHVIEHLLSGLADRGLAVPADVARASILTDYATFGRYPGGLEPVTADEHTEAVALAAAVLAWAAAQIGTAPSA